ncbi:MAG: YihY/virulence factor BrkB family protein [Chloroflexi bacterium]|nr:YihY/virulence factor BrkB family protein [Chloroflexota bacterium]
MKLKDLWGMLKETFKEWNEDKAPRLAAALAYYTIFAIAPLLLIIISIAGFVIGNNATVQQQILQQVEATVGPQGAQAVQTIIENASRPGAGIIATIIGVVTLLVGATGLFGQLQGSLNTIWDVKPKEGRGITGMLKDRFLSFTMILGLCFLLLVSLVISTAISVLNSYFSDLLGGTGIIAQIVDLAISIGIITFIFAMIFKILPDVEIAWSDVWIGALITAVLFTIGKYLLSWYLSTSAPGSAYGAAGSLVILLLWVYYSAQILFFGAEFTQVYSRRYGRELKPSEHAVRVTEEERARQGMLPRERAQASGGLASREAGSGAASVMIPVAGQPAIHPETAASGAGPTRRERIRHEPPNPAVVVPVIAGGALAGALAIGRVVRQLTSGSGKSSAQTDSGVRRGKRGTEYWYERTERIL